MILCPELESESHKSKDSTSLVSDDKDDDDDDDDDTLSSLPLLNRCVPACSVNVVVSKSLVSLSVFFYQLASTLKQ